jgi:hypothetical protein
LVQLILAMLASWGIAPIAKHIHAAIKQIRFMAFCLSGEF